MYISITTEFLNEIRHFDKTDVANLQEIPQFIKHMLLFPFKKS
jgi:hypothetical protein